MIQFNLLPDVKIQFIRLQRIKRLVITISSLVAIVSLVIFILLFTYVDIAQKKHLSDLSGDISSTQNQLGSTSNLNKILTIQNQLETLPTLDAQKPVATRLFNDLIKVTPASASISQIQVNFAAAGLTTGIASPSTADTMQIQGNADGLTTVNQFVDTLKFTTFSDASSSPDAFTNVVLTAFGLQTGKGATYTINLNFNPLIFAENNGGDLTVPNKTTTRSITDQPTDLFKKSTVTTNSAASGSTP